VALKKASIWYIYMIRKRALAIAQVIKAAVSPRGQWFDWIGTFEKMGYLWLPPIFGKTGWCIPHCGIKTTPWAIKSSIFGQPERSRSYTSNGEIPAEFKREVSHWPPLCSQMMLAPLQIGSASMALIALISPATQAGKQMPVAPEPLTSSSVKEYGRPCSR